MRIGSTLAVLRRAFRPSDDAIHQWWPLRLSWCRRGALSFFDWHGWQTGWESAVCGARRVFGQTIHVGALKICLGGPIRLIGEAEGEADRWCARQSPPPGGAS